MVGKNLSHYKILEELGRGGMGIVYKAEDTKLDRTVAIKVLPFAALASEDDRARFYREAKAAAQLHHPHIASVFEIDEAVSSDAPHGTQPSPFIAMEYIEGKTLDAKIKEGPFKLEDAIRIASEIASALEAAHKKDIVHRDIKSQNVMLTEEGAAKVLDFGLAQTAQSTKLTRMGSTLGTIAYMSPEQACGEEVDLRTDLWSLGVVLYEMISGRSPFPGNYEQAVVYEILNQVPKPLTAVRTGTPMQLEWLVNKLLAKSADERYQSATGLLVDLKTLDLKASGTSQISGTMSAVQLTQAASTPAFADTAPSLLEAARTAWPMIAAAFILALGIGYLAFYGGDQQSARQLVKLPIHLAGITNVNFPSISPTSEFIAFTGTDTLRQSGLFLFNARSGETSYVRGSTGAVQSSFSPDGGTLVVAINNGLHLVTVPSGVPRLLISPGSYPLWESSETIYYFDSTVKGTFRIDLETRATTSMVLPDTSVIDPYEYYIWTADPKYHLGIGMRNLSGGAEPTLLFVKQDSKETHFSEGGVTTPHFVQGGFLAYQIGGDFGPIKVRPFDSVSLEFTGPPRDLLPEIEWSARTVGAEGSLVFVPEQFDKGASADRLFLVNIANKSIRSIDPSLPGDARVVRPAFSPDGLSIALDTQNNESSDRFITVFDLETGLFSRRTFAEPRLDPAWSADGAFLFFDGKTSRSPGIYRQAIGDVGDEVLLVEGNAGDPSLSSNAKWLAFSRDSDLLLSDLQTGNELVLDSSEGAQRFPDFSPDNRYIVFETTSSGISEVVVRPVSGSSFHSINTPDARKPVWGPDGKSLYYLVVSDGIYRLPVTTTPDFEVLGAAEKIVSIRGLISAQRFDVSPDGNTLAITANSVEPETGSNRNKYSTIIWWQNWAQSLSKD